ncbi:M48 family metalloprotease [Sphingomonas cavernae]|uniref:Peptidase M48 Ste24p n=1 Tax=Sphingomonas cavernae TaxID=2320861 RepID=A0A418WP68_9SPHN|nr:M48 family metalloprotease [Sphingomonas cavernae]RJF93027.1 peptidase M48 Ste24p [Sphingomonas cavernae]
MFQAAALLACASLALPGTAQQPQSISARDKQQGAQAHPELLQEFGGAYSGSPVPYVTRVGQKIAVQSGLSNSQSDFTITLLNSPVNNAFAIPGGYVYVTRQLMALMNDEAELASVLGHEVGHVAARHSAKRQSAATRNTILGVLGQVLVGAVAGSSGLGQLLQQGVGQAAQLATLSFSRSQEYEADDLGIQYLVRAGYDPAASSSMLASLAAQTALESRQRGGAARTLPEWASTHPDPASRVTRALNQARKTGATGGARNRDAFLTALNGVLYDDDPRQGIVDGNSFRHPDLKLMFTVPQGYSMANGTTAVSVSGSNGQAQFSGGALNGSLDSYIDSVFRGLGGQSGNIGYGQIQRTQVNGLDAAYAIARANTQSGEVAVTVFAYQFDPRTAYHFVAITPVSNPGIFNTMYRSVRRLNAAEASAIKPRRVQVVTVQAGQTPQTFAARMAYPDYRLERFMILNALQANSRLNPGQRVKIVTY